MIRATTTTTVVIALAATVLVVALVSAQRAQSTPRVVEPAPAVTRTTVSPERPVRPLRILLVGDSIMENTGDHVLEQLRMIYGDDVVVRVEGHNGSGLLTESPVDWNDHLEGMLRDFDPDVVVGLFVGNYPAAWPYVAGPDGRPMLPNSEEYFAAWRSAAEDLTQRVVAGGAKMWWVTPPPTDHGEMWDTRVARNAEAYRRIAATHPGTEIIESGDAIGGPAGGFVAELPDPATGRVRPVRHSDRIHLTSFGGRLLARAIAFHLSASAAAKQAGDVPSAQG